MKRLRWVYALGHSMLKLGGWASACGTYQRPVDGIPAKISLLWTWLRVASQVSDGLLWVEGMAVLAFFFKKKQTNNWTRCLPKFWGHPLLIPFRQSIIEQSEYYHLRADVPQMSFHTLGGRVHNLALEDCLLKKGPIRLKIVPKWQVDTGSCSTKLGAEEVSCEKLWLYWIIFFLQTGNKFFAILSYIHKPFIKWARRPAKTGRHIDTKRLLFYPGIGTSRHNAII